eukprot:5340930-Alexandrium_andersonii.AAC.1
MAKIRNRSGSFWRQGRLRKFPLMCSRSVVELCQTQPQGYIAGASLGGGVGGRGGRPPRPT